MARAVLVSLTYDEAATYLRYISTSFSSVFSFSVATNHLVNTLLVRLCYSVGGASELVLRLPNIVAFASYLLFAFLILARLRHRVIAGAGFVLINLNPYLLDYFALCRGYGLSLGLLMASLYFLLKSVHADTGLPSRACVWQSLILAGGAAAASFPSLTVFLALWGVWCLALVERSRPAVGFASPAVLKAVMARAVQGRRAVPCLLFAFVFTALCASQDTGLSPALYERLTVSVAGLSEAELPAVKVSRLNLRGRYERLARRGTLWESAGRDPFSGLRIEIPRSTAESQGLIQVAIGKERFSHSLTGQNSTFLAIVYSGSFQALDAAPALALTRSRLPAFQAIMNWSGDRTLLRSVVVVAFAWTGLLVGIVAVLSVALVVLTWWREEMKEYVAPLVWTPAWAAAAIGYPLWVLLRDGELYYGGTKGLVADTFTSLVGGFLYSSLPQQRERQLILGGLAVALLAVLAVMAVRARRSGLRAVSAPACLMVTLALVTAGIELEHWLVGIPYPVGRTALFFVPLFMLFVVMALDAACDIGRLSRASATGVLLLATGLAGWHFARVANVSRTSDWAEDADTRSVMADVRRAAMAQPTPPASVSLGVDARFFPSAVYYAGRPGYPAVHVWTTPTDRPLDFLYALGAGPETEGDIVRQFPSGAVLVHRRVPR